MDFDVHGTSQASNLDHHEAPRSSNTTMDELYSPRLVQNLFMVEMVKMPIIVTIGTHENPNVMHVTNMTMDVEQGISPFDTAWQPGSRLLIDDKTCNAMEAGKIGLQYHRLHPQHADCGSYLEWFHPPSRKASTTTTRTALIHRAAMTPIIGHGMLLVVTIHWETNPWKTVMEAMHRMESMPSLAGFTTSS